MVQTVQDGAATSKPAQVFQLNGPAPGSRLAVIGKRSDLERVAARLEAIPRSACLKGSIILAVDAGAVVHCDRLLRLDDVPSGADVATAPSTAFYWAIVQQAAVMGILKGRKTSRTTFKRGLRGLTLGALSRKLAPRPPRTKPRALSGEWRNPFPMI